MECLKKKYVVMVDGSTKGEKGNLCFIRENNFMGAKYGEFSPLRSKGKKFDNKDGAELCCGNLRYNGYSSWVEDFYSIGV